MVGGETDRHWRLRLPCSANQSENAHLVVWMGRNRSDTKPGRAYACNQQAAVGKEGPVFEETSLGPCNTLPHQ